MGNSASKSSNPSSTPDRGRRAPPPTDGNGGMADDVNIDTGDEIESPERDMEIPTEIERPERDLSGNRGVE